MTNPSQPAFDHRPWRDAVEGYRGWLEAHDLSTARLWASRLAAADDAGAEGAVAEAVAWSDLAGRVDDIEPGSVVSGGPDFRCTSGGTEFFVEVTNLSRAVVTEHTKLEDTFPGPRFQAYGDLTGLFKREVCSKAGKGPGRAAPFVVMVTTLHCGAAVCFNRSHIEHVLYSRTALRGDFNPELGEIVSMRETTQMELGAFTRQYTVNPERRNVSAVVVACYGVRPSPLLGVLHPEPIRRFRSELIRDVPFCEFSVWPPDPRIVVLWTDQVQTT